MHLQIQTFQNQIPKENPLIKISKMNQSRNQSLMYQ